MNQTQDRTPNTRARIFFRATGALAALFISLMATACGSGTGTSVNADGITRIEGVMSNCFGDSMRLYEYWGGNLKTLGAGKLEKTEDGYSFSLSAPGLTKQGLYLFGPDPRMNVGLLVVPGRTLKVSGDCNNLLNTFVAYDAPEHEAYNRYMQRVADIQGRSNQLMQELQQVQFTNPQAVPAKQEEMNQVNNSYYAYLDSVVKGGGFLGKLASIYAYKPFMSDPSHSAYADETAYFKENFFVGVDLKDADLDHIPQLADKVKFFASNMAGRGLPNDEVRTLIDKYLGQTQQGSIARRLFYQGVIDGLDAVKSDLYIDYGKQFVAEYPSDPMALGLNQQIASMEAFRAGAAAPDLAGQTPSGTQLKLADLRGKVVLVDFWASWCRPCRMENPNVKKAYAKYSGKGFEILGVSLDNTKDKWVQAIEQDGLPWKHISDLRGWQSEHARLYGVNSIPATFLLDKEGKIIAKNLRGPALEAKLAEIFGS